MAAQASPKSHPHVRPGDRDSAANQPSEASLQDIDAVAADQEDNSKNEKSGGTATGTLMTTTTITTTTSDAPTTTTSSSSDRHVAGNVDSSHVTVTPVLHAHAHRADAVLRDMAIEDVSRIRSQQNSQHYRRQPQQHQQSLHQEPLCHLKTLPQGTRPVELVGEGAANAVFRLSVPQAPGASRDFQGYLLRVAKVGSLAGPLTYDYQRQNRFFTSVIQPMFGEYAIHHELVHLAKSGIVKDLNAFLRKNEHLRKPKFRGTYVGESPLGFLVEDMQPPGSDLVLIEFKPKWLVQSPSAPADAVRCRQCALEFQRFILDSSDDVSSHKDKPCPLSLANDASWQINSPYRIAPRLAAIDTQRRLAPALQAVIDHDVIHLLRQQQRAYDRKGPLYASASDMSLALAMTLRDCTCFVQLAPEGGDAPVKIRLGDFDWKASEAKVKHWRDTEIGLIDGGFYTAGKILCGEQTFSPPSQCTLEWESKEAGSTDHDVIFLHDKGAATTGDGLQERASGRSSRTYAHTVDVSKVKAKLVHYASTRRNAAIQAKQAS